jgi:hypothetical protein
MYLFHFTHIIPHISLPQSGQFFLHIGAKVQAQRQEKKLALEEYYEKHGHSGHH